MTAAATWADAVALLHRMARTAAADGSELGKTLADKYEASARALEEREALRNRLVAPQPETLATPWGAWLMFVKPELRGCGAAVDAEMVALADQGSPERTRRLALAAVRAFVERGL